MSRDSFCARFAQGKNPQKQTIVDGVQHEKDPPVFTGSHSGSRPADPVLACGKQRYRHGTGSSDNRTCQFLTGRRALPDGGELQLLEPSPDAETQTDHSEGEPEQPPEEALLPEDGSYTSKEDVSLYLMTYGHLPFNFVTKDEAEKAGWNGGSLEYVLPGKCIGGDRFGNREGQLPKAKGRTWRECDINTLGKRSRGPERLVYSNDGLIYYTPDHYETFTRLY